MSFGEWKDVILLALGFALSIAAGLVGALIQRHMDRRVERRPLNQLLNFGRDTLLFIFPRRDTSPKAILPRTSTEDFLAMNNFISALLNMGWTRKTGVRDVGQAIGDLGHVTQSDKQRNLVIICSPKSNSLAAIFQTALRSMHPNAFAFESEGTESEGTQVFITDGDGASYRSPSFKQEADYLKDGLRPQELSSKHFDDYAVITKVASPWAGSAKVVWLAGVRGIGTWGAAECIKKEWRQIYDRLPLDDKTCDFSALLKVEYDNCDITSVKVRRVEILREGIAA